MFKFTTNTLINSLTFPGFGNVPTSHSGSDKIAEHPRFWVDKAVADDPVLNIAKHFQFRKSNVVAVYKRVHSLPKTFKVTFDVTPLITAKAELGRILLYIRLSGSQNSYYSNDFVFKGKPFAIEFPIKDTAENTAKAVVNIAKKYQIMVYENELFQISADGTTVTIEGNDEYQVVKTAELQAYNEDKLLYDCCAKFGGWDDTAKGIVVTQGKEGFGTFRQIMKDLRLPTAANTRWIAIQQDERPIPGANYDEYIIKMCVDRGIMGGDAVGEVTKSLTSHVFYVNSDIATKWEEALTDAGLTDIMETVDKDLDDVALTDTVIEESYNNPAKVVAAEATAHATKTANTGKVKESDDAALAAVQSGVTANAAAITAETTAREAADTTLQANIDKKADKA